MKNTRKIEYRPDINGLRAFGYDKHYRVHNGKNEFVRASHISME